MALLGPHEPVRVLRLISRLNIGGPAIQAISLTRLLEERGYESLLVRGVEGPREGTMDALAHELGVRPVRVPTLGRELGPSDLRTLGTLVRIMRRFRPHVLHTHAAKAGTIGRIASLLAGSARPAVTVHTFHGHVLTGYFSPRKERLFRGIERTLARRTSRLVAVSNEVRADLVRLGIAPPEAIEVVPLGFDLSPFAAAAEQREELRAEVRAELGLSGEAPLVTLVARLVPIKRVDRFLRIARRVAADPAGARVRFLVVGDGELEGELRGSEEARALGDRVLWLGFRSDMARLCAASDAVALTSDNEGTPVSLIEAQAAAAPVVSTTVGGVPAVVADGETGRAVAPDDEAGFAAALLEAVSDPVTSRERAARGQRHVLSAFALERLVDDIDGLYRGLLEARRAPTR